MPKTAKERKHRGVFERNKGSKIWWVRYTDVDGKRKARCVGTFSDAVNAYEAEKVRIRKGEWTGGLQPRKNIVRVTELCDDGLTYSARNHRDTKNFKQRIEVIRAAFGSRIADSLKPAEVQDWLHKNAEWTPATRNRYRAAFSKILKLGIQNQKVQRNVARLVPQRAEDNRRLRWLSPDEETRLRENLKACYLQQLDIALNTGMRKSEQFGLVWDDVDLHRAELHLSRTKNGNKRVVKLNSLAVQALLDLKDSHERLGLPANAPLFLNARNIPIADPREWFQNACENVNISGATWHTLRHTFASRLVMAGVDLRTVQELMGHKTQAMTVRYAHLSEEHKTKALELIVSK